MGVTVSYVLELIDCRLRQEIAERVRRDDIETPRELIEWLIDLRRFRRSLDRACGPGEMCKPLDLLVDLVMPEADVEARTRVVCEAIEQRLRDDLEKESDRLMEQVFGPLEADGSPDATPDQENGHGYG